MSDLLLQMLRLLKLALTDPAASFSPLLHVCQLFGVMTA